MKNENVNEIIKEILKTIKPIYSDFKGIYFFGSRLKGDFHEESDLDLMLLFERAIDWKFKNIINDIICDFDLKYGIIIDSKIYSYSDIMNPITPFRKSVLNEGKYYAA
jgi:predicted nucleotidyltransferase